MPMEAMQASAKQMSGIKSHSTGYQPYPFSQVSLSSMPGIEADAFANPADRAANLTQDYSGLGDDSPQSACFKESHVDGPQAEPHPPRSLLTGQPVEHPQGKDETLEYDDEGLVLGQSAMSNPGGSVHQSLAQSDLELLEAEIAVQEAEVQMASEVGQRRLNLAKAHNSLA